MYWVLAVVDSHTKSGKNGETVNCDQCCPNAHDRRPLRFAFFPLSDPLDPRLDKKDAEALLPRWSHDPGEMLVDQAEYELTRIPLTSVSLVTMKTIKVKRRST